MGPAIKLWDFVEKCQGANTLSEIENAFLTEMGRLGFAHVALCSHVDPLNPPEGAVAIFRYPASWLAHFSAEGYQRFDPVFMEAKRRDRPFHWSEPQFLQTLDNNQQRVLSEGAEAGVANGFTIPIRGPDALPASCSLVPDADGVDPHSYALAHSMAVLAHERARRLHAVPLASDAPHLTKRERECLTLVARGKSDWAISKILGVSERATRHAIENARIRLGVATRTQAIVRALFSGEISLYDAID